MKKQGFTLIELLAVIVILGIVMAIAIPGINMVINNTKKNSFVREAELFVSAARNKVRAEEVKVPNNPSEVTIISLNALEMDKGGKTSSFNSPWNYNRSYVLIHNEGTSGEPKLVYYIALEDEADNGINLTNIEGNLELVDGETSITNIGYEPLIGSPSGTTNTGIFSFKSLTGITTAHVYLEAYTGGTLPKPEVIKGSFKWKKYRMTKVIDVKTTEAIGETSLFFNPVFIFENNLNLKPNALYNVLLSGKTFDTEYQLVDNEYTFNHITSQNLLSDNQLLEFSGEQGGYRIIKKTNDPMELVMELIVDLNQDSGLVGLIDLFKEEEELFLNAYKDYDNIEELIFSLFESFEIKYGFTPEMGYITESEFLLFLMLTDSSITSNYFEDDYENIEKFTEDLMSLATDLFGHVPDIDFWELFMFLSITDFSNYVGIGDTWAIDIGELSMFSPAYGESLDRIKIEELQAVGFVGGEEGDYPENGEKDGYWYVFEGENK